MFFCRKIRQAVHDEESDRLREREILRIRDTAEPVVVSRRQPGRHGHATSGLRIGLAGAPARARAHLTPRGRPELPHAQRPQQPSG